MGPVVAEVEGVGELLAQGQPGQLRPVTALDRTALRRVVPGVSWPDEQRPVGEVDRVQVRQVPTTEGVVDGRGELTEGVGRVGVGLAGLAVPVSQRVLASCRSAVVMSEKTSMAR